MRKARLFLGICALGIALSACGKKAPAVESVSTPASIEESKDEVSDISDASVNGTGPDATVSAEEENNTSEPKFVFTRQNYPVVDGSTSLRPLGLNMTSLLLGEEKDSVEELLNFHRTDEAYVYLMSGKSDILIAAQGCKEIMDYYEEAGFEYDSEPIAMEALVFVVNENNPVDSLTIDEIKKIYTGEITNWSQVGGEDIDIVAFQRTETSGSQVMMRECVMTDCELMEAPTELMPGFMSGLIDGVASYNNEANAIGYTVYYYADSMKMADGLKIINVDGIEPCNDTISSGEYPFRNPYFCVIAKSAEADSPERIMYDWLVSAEGQNLVAKSGYVPINPVDTSILVQDRVLQPKENKFTRLKDGYIGKYKAGTSNGNIYPFLLSAMESDSTDIWISEYMYSTKVNRYGFVDETGMIVSDYGYSDVSFSEDGYWKVSDYNGEDVCISLDGKAVIPVLTWMHKYGVDNEKLVFSDEYIYKYRSKRTENPDEVFAEITETKYDCNGLLLSEKEVNFDKSIIGGLIGVQWLEDFYAVAEDLYFDRYLKILSGGGEWAYSEHILDLETGKIIITDMQMIKPIDNRTFICEKDYSHEKEYYLYDCEGNKINDEAFSELQYLGDDYFITREGNINTVTIYKYEDGTLTPVNSLQSYACYVKEGFFISKETENGQLAYYNPDGSVLDPNDNYNAVVFSNALELGCATLGEYAFNGGMYIWEDFFVDLYDKRSEQPGYYSNPTYHYEIEKTDNYIFNLATKEKIELGRNKREFLGTPYVINGILCVDNELRDINTGNIIFSYNPFVWDNAE